MARQHDSLNDELERKRKTKLPPSPTHDQFESQGVRGALLRQLILGGQDGLVNVLGLILGVAAATSNPHIVIVAGVAATFAESISMAAVAYTSTKAARDAYARAKAREDFEITHFPKIEEAEVRKAYYDKGFRGRLLDGIVRHITGSRKRWIDDMMVNELHLTESDFDDPMQEALVVGVSAIAGSLIPLLPFFFLGVWDAMLASLVFSTLVLFTAGAVKTSQTVGNWLRGGVEMSAIGIMAAIAGYAIGKMLGAA